MDMKTLIRRVIIAIIAMAMSQMAFADIKTLIPAIAHSFYYQIGGGNDVPLPAFYDTSAIPLSVEADVGLSFDCGAFNPVASIRNSLNGIKHSALNVERQVISNLTGAIIELPLYELSRADPNLYNLITNAMAGAHQAINVATKSCEVVQSEIAAGQNPYAQWGQISLGHLWRQEIGTAALSGNGDVNEARDTVSHDGGKSGVPWVDPNAPMSAMSGQTHYAGGQHQPPIQVIYDTAMSGYHIIQGSQSGASHSTAELTAVFPTAKTAAHWITNVVGDQTVTTYNGGQKRSQAGVGLYVMIQQQTQQLLPSLAALVAGTTALTVANLQAISPYGMALSPDVIKNIRQQSTVVQHILVNKLAQNMAAMTVMNKARLAMRLLQAGSRVPAIYSNSVAQRTIQQAIGTMQHDIQTMLLFIHARQTLLSNMLATVMQAGQAKNRRNTMVSLPSSNHTPMMERGAIPEPH